MFDFQRKSVFFFKSELLSTETNEILYVSKSTVTWI